MSTLSISSTVKKYPKLPYGEMATEILGKKYGLSLVFIGTARATNLNKTHRKKTYAPNILSFPLDEKSGEIFICPELAKKECQKFNLTQKGYIAYLFIHGCLHLKGHDHSDTMEKQEQKFLRKFGIK